MGIYEDAYSHPELAQAIADKDCHEIARVLSIGRVKGNSETLGNGTILEVLGMTAGTTFLDIINSAPEFKYVKPLIAEGRLKIGSQLVQDQITNLVAAGALQPAQGEALRALGLDPDPLTQREVAMALYHDDGEPK